jgi:hypothetical protein
VKDLIFPVPYIIKDLYHARPGKKIAVRHRTSEKTAIDYHYIITVTEIDKNKILTCEEGCRFDLNRGDFDVIYSNRIMTDDGPVRFYYYDEL